MQAQPDGTFLCPCSCNKSFINAITLKRHARNQAAPSELVPGPVPCSILQEEDKDGNELATHPVLNSLGYIVNKRGRFLICTTCHLPVLPSMASGHAHGHYPEQVRFSPQVLEGPEGPIKKFNLFIKAKDFQDAFFSTTPSTLPPLAFQGVPVQYAYACSDSDCVHARSNPKSLETHWRERHSGKPFIEPAPVPCQLIYLSPQFNRLLPITLGLSSPAADDDMRACLQAYRLLPKQEPLEPDTHVREPPPWLRKLGWLDWISNNPQDLERLQTFKDTVKTDPLFHLLTQFLTRYLAHGMQLLRQMPPQIRQRLRSITE